MKTYQISYDCQLMDNHIPYTANVSTGMQRAITQRFSGGYNLYILDISGGVTIYTINDDSPTGSQQRLLNDIILSKESSIRGEVSIKDVAVVYQTVIDSSIGDTDTYLFFIFSNNGSCYLGAISQATGSYASMNIDKINASSALEIRLLVPQAVCNTWPGDRNNFPVVIACSKYGNNAYELYGTSFSSEISFPNANGLEYLLTVEEGLAGGIVQQHPDNAQSDYQQYWALVNGNTVVPLSTGIDNTFEGGDSTNFYQLTYQNKPVTWWQNGVAVGMFNPARQTPDTANTFSEIYLAGDCLYLTDQLCKKNDSMPGDSYKNLGNLELTPLMALDENTLQLGVGYLFNSTEEESLYGTPTSVFVWRIAESNNDTQLEISTVDFNKRTDSSVWKKPLPLLKNILYAHVEQNPSTGNLEVLAICADETQTNSFNCIRMIQDTHSPSKLWSKHCITEPDMKGYHSIKTYTNRVRITDEKGVPVTDSFTLGANSTALLNINGLNQTVTPAKSINVTPDAVGELNIMMPISNLGAPYLSLKNDNMESPSFIPVTAGTHNTITSMDDDTISKFNAATGKTPSSDNITLFKNSQSNINSIQINSDGTIKIPDNTSTEMVLSFDLFHALGDLVEFVDHIVEDVEKAVITVVDDAYYVVITIAGDLYHAVLTVAQDVVRVMQSIFKFLEAAWEDIYKFFAFLFDWEEIKKNAGYLETLYGSALDLIPEALTLVKDEVNNWLQVTPAVDPKTTAKLNGGATSTATRQNGNVKPVGKTDMRTSSKAGWIKQHTSSAAVSQGKSLQMAAMKRAGITPPIIPSPPLDESFDQYLEDLGEAISADFNNFGNTVHQQFDDYLNNQQTATAGELIDNLVNDAAKLVISMAKSFVEQTFDFIVNNAELVKSGQSSSVSIPILSEFASSESVLSVSCLAQSVIATLTYELENPDSSQKLSDVLGPEVASLQQAIQNLKDQMLNINQSSEVKLGQSPETAETIANVLRVFKVILDSVKDIAELATNDNDDSKTLETFLGFCTGGVGVFIGVLEAVAIFSENESPKIKKLKAAMELIVKGALFSAKIISYEKGKKSKTLDNLSDITNGTFGIWTMVDGIENNNWGAVVSGSAEFLELPVCLMEDFKSLEAYEGYIVALKDVAGLAGAIIILLSHNDE